MGAGVDAPAEAHVVVEDVTASDAEREHLDAHLARCPVLPLYSIGRLVVVVGVLHACRMERTANLGGSNDVRYIDGRMCSCAS